MRRRKGANEWGCLDLTAWSPWATRKHLGTALCVIGSSTTGAAPLKYFMKFGRQAGLRLLGSGFQLSDRIPACLTLCDWGQCGEPLGYWQIHKQAIIERTRNRLLTRQDAYKKRQTAKAAMRTKRISPLYKSWSKTPLSNKTVFSAVEQPSCIFWHLHISFAMLIARNAILVFNLNALKCSLPTISVMLS